MQRAFTLPVLIALLLVAPAALAAAAGGVSFTGSPLGYAILLIFVAAYALVFLEEKLHLRKSKPMLLAAGLTWIFVTAAYHQQGIGDQAVALLRHNLLEFVELFLFLLAAMSYVNAMVERNVFGVLRSRLVAARFTLRGLFWVTGGLAFTLSPVVDNLTAALVMGMVVMALAPGNKPFIAAGLVNIVVAANAGGAFSPFGDITTLMIWQKGVVAFTEFFVLFVPSLINWLLPAAIMALTIPRTRPQAEEKRERLKPGGWVMVALFLITIALTILLHQWLHLPPCVGMMFGLGLLKMYGFVLQVKEKRAQAPEPGGTASEAGEHPAKPYDIFDALRDIEWDTLLFFYGIILCIGGIGAMGYLAALSQFLYTDLGATNANISLGVLSAVLDNIPLTFAVLSMEPTMSHGQWLLLTLTVGTGGSLLAIGSAAGVALLGVGKGAYTFLSHLKWSWAVLLGYVASIMVHFFLNAALFDIVK